jgi:hypothetical protein
MEDKPKFMSGRWQRKLLRERPVLFGLLVLVIGFPFLFALRLGVNGELGRMVQTGLHIAGACLGLGLIWLLVVERMRRKERNALIDSYLERRYDETHRKDPPSA